MHQSGLLGMLRHRGEKRVSNEGVGAGVDGQVLIDVHGVTVGAVSHQRSCEPYGLYLDPVMSRSASACSSLASSSYMIREDSFSHCVPCDIFVINM